MSDAERITALRQQLGWSHAQMAADLGISIADLQAVEAGQQPALAQAIITQLRAALQPEQEDATPSPATPYWDASIEDAAVLAVLLKLYHDAISAGYDASTAVGAPVAAAQQDAGTASLTATLAQRVTDINQTTKDTLDQVIRDGIAKGYSTAQIADGVPADGYAGVSGVFADARGYRAQMIARTEASTAFNLSSVQAYRQSGKVQHVEVSDGDGDPECADADGSVWTLDYAEANPLAHPNCVRQFYPLVASDAS